MTLAVSMCIRVETIVLFSSLSLYRVNACSLQPVVQHTCDWYTVCFSHLGLWSGFLMIRETSSRQSWHICCSGPIPRELTNSIAGIFSHVAGVESLLWWLLHKLHLDFFLRILLKWKSAARSRPGFHYKELFYCIVLPRPLIKRSLALLVVTPAVFYSSEALVH